MPESFFDHTAVALVKVLDGASARQRALAENIANVDTPGYLRKEVTFESELREVLSRQGANPDAQLEAIAGVPVSTDVDRKTPGRADGNNVDVEREMSTMAKNSLQYEAAAQLLNGKIRGLRNAIHEGRR